MGFSKEETTSVFTLTAYPFFCETVANDAEAVKKLNALDASAGEYMRPTLEKMEQFLNDGCVDPDACAKIEDNYEAVILRFFEGDVPMMICSGDTVSGTKKRESVSEAFIANPFEYTFAPVPMSDKGTSFLDMSCPVHIFIHFFRVFRRLDFFPSVYSRSLPRCIRLWNS